MLLHNGRLHSTLKWRVTRDLRVKPSRCYACKIPAGDASGMFGRDAVAISVVLAGFGVSVDAIFDAD